MDKKHLNICLKINRVLYTLCIFTILVLSFGLTVNGYMIIGFVIVCAFPFCVGKVIKTNNTLWYVFSVITGLIGFLIIAPVATSMTNPVVWLFLAVNTYNAYVFTFICTKPELRAFITQS